MAALLSPSWMSCTGVAGVRPLLPLLPLVPSTNAALRLVQSAVSRQPTHEPSAAQCGVVAASPRQAASGSACTLQLRQLGATQMGVVSLHAGAQPVKDRKSVV